MPNSILYLTRHLLPPQSVALGDLVTNPTHPWEGSRLRYDKSWTLTSDIKVKYHTIEEIFKHITPIGIDAHANLLFGQIISSGKEATDTLDHLQAKCTKLLDPLEKFSTFYLQDQKVRAWLQGETGRTTGRTTGKKREDVYLVTGLYSLSNAQVAALVKRVNGSKTGEAISIEGIPGEDDLGKKGSAMVHRDEQIFGIKYRKVGLEE